MIADINIWPSLPEFMNPGGSFSFVNQSLVCCGVATVFAIGVIAVNQVKNKVQSYDPDRVLYYSEILGFFGTLWLLDHVTVIQFTLTSLVLYSSGLLRPYGFLMICRAIGLLLFYPYLNIEDLEDGTRCAIELFASLISFAATTVTQEGVNSGMFSAGYPIPLVYQEKKVISL